MQKLTVTHLVVSLVCLLAAAAASAQDAFVTTAAPIFVLPDSNRVPLRTAAVNTRLQVLEEKPEGWVRVEFQDPQLGKRVGFIEARNVKILRPELEPMDLYVGREPARAPAAPEIARPPAPPATQPVSTRRPFARGWIDVNLGFAVAAESRYGTIFEAELFRETATFTADYRSPLGAEFDFGGGVMFTPAFGIGVSFAGTAHQDNAELGIRIPHPTFFNVHASDTGQTDDTLMRSEGSANIQAMFVSHLSDRATVRVFAGPSYFRIRQDAVSNIIFDHDFLILSPVHAVTPRGIRPQPSSTRMGAAGDSTSAATSISSSHASSVSAGSPNTAAGPSKCSSRCPRWTWSSRPEDFRVVEGCVYGSRSVSRGVGRLRTTHLNWVSVSSVTALMPVEVWCQTTRRL